VNNPYSIKNVYGRIALGWLVAIPTVFAIILLAPVSFWHWLGIWGSGFVGMVLGCLAISFGYAVGWVYMWRVGR
jgi:hypothetical protein